MKQNITMNQQRIAACYARVSNEDNSYDVSSSIESQIKILQGFCLEQGIEVYHLYTDDGFSGTNFERPGFSQMMEDAKEKKFDTVIVKDMSRFGRNYFLVGNYLCIQFPQMGISFISIGDGVDTRLQGIDQNMLLQIKTVFDGQYPIECSHKTRAALKKKVESGEYIGSKAPYGMKKSPEDKHRLIADEETASVVREIFEMAAYKNYGYSKIAKVLQERKILCPKALQAQREKKIYEGNPYEWGYLTIRSMLLNEVYLGHNVSGKRKVASVSSNQVVRQDREQWIIIPNQHEAIITQQLWDDAHEKRATRTRTSESGAENIFSGLLRCDKCGSALGISNASARDNYFHCIKYQKGGPKVCSSHYIRYDELQRIVLEELRELSCFAMRDRAHFEQQVFEKIQKQYDLSTRDSSQKLSMLQRTLEKLEREYDMIYQDKLDGEITAEAFRRFSRANQSRRDEIERQIGKLKEQTQACARWKQNIAQFSELLAEHGKITELDSEMLHRLIKSITIGDRVTMKDGSKTQAITIHYMFVDVV